RRDLSLIGPRRRRDALAGVAGPRQLHRLRDGLAPHHQARRLNIASPRRSGTLRLLTLFAFLRPYRGRIAFTLVAIAISAAMVLAIGQGLKLVIDQGFARSDPAMFDATLGGVRGIVSGL